MFKIVFAGTVALCLGTAMLPGAEESRPQYLAHRGATLEAPENTLPAYRLAMEQGADGIECDVTFSRDKVIVMSHDASLKRAAGVDRPVEELEFSELRKLDFSCGRKGFRNTPIPTLAETLETIQPGKLVFIDFKKYDEELLLAVRDQLAASGIPAEQVRIMAFQKRILTRSRELMPQYKIVWNVTVKEKDGAGKVNLKKVNTGVEGVRQKVLEELQTFHPDAINILADQKIVDASFVRQLKDTGLYVMVWVVNKPEIARHFAGLGVDAFVTDCPEVLRKAVETATGTAK